MKFEKKDIGHYSYHDGYRSWIIVPLNDHFQASYKEPPTLAKIFVSPTEVASGDEMIKAALKGITMLPHNFKTYEEAEQACQMKLRVLQKLLN